MGHKCKKTRSYKMESPHKSYPLLGDEIPVKQYEMEEQ